MTRAVLVTRNTWILFAVAALAFHVYSVLFTEAADSHVVFGWAMMVLTFPLGLLPMFAYGLLAQASGGQSSDLMGFVGIASLWLAMTAAGLFQWFWLVPTALRRARSAGKQAGER